MKNLETHNQDGSSLIEVILYIGLLLVFIVSMIDFSLGIISSSTKLRTVQDVHHSVRFSSYKISYLISQAERVNTEFSIFNEDKGVLALEMRDGSLVKIFSENKILFIERSGDSSIRLTPTNVEVEKLKFLKIGASGSELITLDLLFDHVNEGNRNDYLWEQSISTSVAIKPY